LLRDEDEVIGVLSTHFRSPRTISETDEQLVDLLARQTNALIQRLHAENELKALTDTLEQRVETATRQIREKEESVRDLASRLTMAEHQERDRIAQILHDDLQQLLYSIRLRFTFLREGIGSENGNDQLENVAKAEEWVDQAIRTTQQLAVDLSPQVLRNEGLVESLRWLAAQMEQLHGLRVRIDAKAGTLLSKAADILLFQSIRELLFNVVKHAETDEGFVDLSEADGTLRIRVVDRGKGFDVAEMKKHQGFGVLSIQHRASLLGGEMGIESEAGKGTAATIELPIESIKRSA
jgi:signal transduction histidine kinase